MLSCAGKRISLRDKYIKSTLAPDFWVSEELTAVVPGESLFVECWDWDRISGDDKIGETVIVELEFFCSSLKRVVVVVVVVFVVVVVVDPCHFVSSSALGVVFFFPGTGLGEPSFLHGVERYAVQTYRAKNPVD